MRILHLIYTHGIAGAEKYLLDLLPGLKQYGIECDVICVCPHSHKVKVEEFCNRLREGGIVTELLPTTRLNLLGVARRINKYCSVNGITIIHSHLFNSDIIAVAVKMLFNKRLHLLSTKHGYKESYFINNPDGPGKIPYNPYYFLSRFVISRIDKNITISKAISDLYYTLKLSPQKMPFIHHGIGVDKKIKEEAGVAYKKSLPQLVIVGRLAKIKGHAFLFNAMPQIIRQFPQVHLLILGEGSERAELEKQVSLLGIADHVSFMGFQNNPYAYIQASDIIVLPSLYEPFGLVYIEAFALRIPIVAFDVPACNEIVTHQETGILVPSRNSAALATGICTLLNDQHLRKQITENGYRRYIEYFNTDRMIKDTAVWYNTGLNIEQ